MWKCAQIPWLALAFLIFPIQADESSSKAGLDISSIQEFDRLDRNRDRSLDDLEFLYSEVSQRIRESGNRKAVADVFTALDKDANDGLSLLEFGQSQQNRNVRLLDRTECKAFIKSDTNQDGWISLAEYMKRPKAKESSFRSVDFNKNKTSYNKCDDGNRI